MARRPYSKVLLSVLALAIASNRPEAIAVAEIEIKAAGDSANTVVTEYGQNYRIDGGRTSSDGTNLFHSFEKFGLEQGRVAEFRSRPNIENILGRVVGGDPSRINGLIQVTGGNSNLYLLNPAGIIFGPAARLNLPASFTATTATGIGFDGGIADGWFNAIGTNNYNALIGNPSYFEFGNAFPGGIINRANLAVNPGADLTLLGGTIISSGSLSAPGGNLTLAAVPGQNRIRISQPGHLLALEISPLSNSNLASELNPPTIAQLLTDPDIGHATGATVNSNGEILLTGSGFSGRQGAASLRT